MNIHKFDRPFLCYFRARRMRQFHRLFSVTPQTRILDVGGEVQFWSSLSVRPRITFLNLSLPRIGASNVSCVIGDGRFLPFKDRSFDIVFSNSVIEHLGDFAGQRLFAEEAARVGVCYYVQTPSRRFPIEPHLLTPLIHFMPARWQRRLIRNFTVWGLVTRPSLEQCDRFLAEVRLLDRRELIRLFPGAEIRKERFLGLTKSLLAVRPQTDKVSGIVEPCSTET